MSRFEDIENAGLRVVIGDDGIVQSIIDSQGRNVGMAGWWVGRCNSVANTIVL